MTEPAASNETQYLEVIRKLDPELYLIRVALKETGVNPMIMPKIIRALGNLAYGTGYGKLQIFMQAKIITSVNGEEKDAVNENVLIDSANR